MKILLKMLCKSNDKYSKIKTLFMNKTILWVHVIY